MASRRRNPLTGEWIIVSPHRITRPWQGETAPQTQGFERVDTYLSPGAVRSSAAVNPNYTSTYVFQNDFPALKPSANLKRTPDELEQEKEEDDELFQSEEAAGDCFVMCFSPHSDRPLPLLSHSEICDVIRQWIKITTDLQHFTYTQVFENKGAMVGCSNPHPHGQIWTSSFLPSLIAEEDTRQRSYLSRHGTPLLVHYLSRELVHRDRIVEEGIHWVALVPYWAKWPFELLVLPKRAGLTRLREMTEEEVEDLGRVMRRYLTRYDNLFSCSFPYSMGWHEAPNTSDNTNSSTNHNNNNTTTTTNNNISTNDNNSTTTTTTDSSHWLLHAHYYPPLLRSATVKKHIAGYEMLAECQRDLTAESAAERLRACDPEIHFTRNT